MKNLLTVHFGITLVAHALSLAVTLWFCSGLIQVGIDAWRISDAVIVEATIEEIEEKIVSSGDGSKIATWVTFSYTFEDQEYRQTTKRLGLFGSSPEIKQKITVHFTEGKPIPCIVSRAHPEFSVFSKEFSVFGFVATLLFPICFGFVAVVTFQEMLKQLRREPDSTAQS